MLKITATGHLGRDATAKALDNGQTVINFSLAHTESFTDKLGNRKETTTWLDCHYWRPSERTGILPYLSKGTKVLIEGTPNVYTYTAKTGETRATLEVKISSIELLGSAQNTPQKPQNTPEDPEMSHDDLPF